MAPPETEREPDISVILMVLLGPTEFVENLVVARLNVAVTLCAELIAIVQVPVPEHPPPDQPANVEPEAAVAVSVTDVPLLYE